MNRPAPAYLAEITAAASSWLRRCSSHPDPAKRLPGLPAAGVPVSSDCLRVALAAGDVQEVAVDAKGRIRWRVGRLRFNAEPVPESPETPA